MFSIFEDYTEWVTKGKMRPNVELGKKVSITTDQFNLIVDYQIMEHQSDSEIVPGIQKGLSIFTTYTVGVLTKATVTNRTRNSFQDVSKTWCCLKKANATRKRDRSKTGLYSNGSGISTVQLNPILTNSNTEG